MSDIQLDIDFLINNPAIREAVRKARLDIKGLADGAQKDVDRLNDGFTKLSKTLAGVFSAHAAKEFISELISVRGQFQQIENSLTTILKSQDAANALMSEWKDLTLRSPYTLSEIAQSGKQLLAYGVDAKNVTKNIEQLANVAAGVSQPLGDIAYLYGTLKTQGRAYQMDINQFTNRGIPIVTELAKVMKVADSEVRSLVEAGKVGFPEVERAISNMTSAGGQFYDLIGKQAETLPGQINRLKHEWELMLNELGVQNEGVLAGSIGMLANLVEHYEKVIDLIKILIITYGAYRTAVILNTVATSGATAAEALHYGLLVLKDKLLTVLTAKTAGLTAATAAYTAVLAALAVVAYAGIQYQTAAEIAEESLTTARAKGERAAAKEQDRIERLTKVIKDHTATKEAQIDAYEDLKASTDGVLDKYSLEEVAAGKADKALEAYAQTVKKAVSAETEYAQYNQLQEKLEEIEEKGIKAVSTMDRLWVSIKRTFAPTSQGMTTGQWWDELWSSDAANNGVANAEKQKLRDAQGKILKGANGKGVQSLIANKGKIVTPEEDAEIKRAKQFARDLGDVIGNFDKLLAGAKNKTDISKIKDAVNEKIEALAPGDARIKQYQDKLKKVTAIEAQYGLSAGNKSVKEAEKWAEKKTALMDKVSAKSAEVTAKGQTDNEKEVLDAQRKYAELRNELNKFNKNAPKAQRIGAGTFTVLDDLEKKETGNIKYDQDTEKLKETLAKQKQLYTDFEEYKKAFGETKAKERFSKQIDTEKDYLKRLEKELEGLKGVDLTGGQIKRKEMLVKEIEDEKYLRQQMRDQEFADAYQAAKTYQQQETEIRQKYSDRLVAIQKEQNGVISFEQRENLKRGLEEEIEAAKKGALAKTEAYKRASEDVFNLSREQVKQELIALKKLIEDGAFTGAAKDKVQSEINKLEFVLKIGVDQTRLNGLKTQLRALNDQLNAKDNAGNSILSKQDTKRILADIAEISAEIEKLSGGTGGAKSKFAQGLAANFSYLKKGSAEVAQGLSNDLGSISGSFNELSQAFGGVDTQTGYLLDTIGSLVKVGSDAAGAFASFASGDIIGGVTKTISAVTGLFSIGKKVREMNAKARQEVADFYANAIAGERAYQELLRERAIQTVRENKTTLNGILEEIRLRKTQIEANRKETAEILAKTNASKEVTFKIFNQTLKMVQGLSYVKSEEYVHGTWFRKAKVNKTYGSLAGMGFEELQQLLMQGKLEGEAKQLVERLVELEKQGFEAEQALKSLGEELNQIFTGTTVDGLTDSLLTLFREGKTGAQDFADFFENAMQDAALSVFQNKVLAEAMEVFYKDFAAASQDGLDDDKIANLRSLFNSLMSDANAQFDSLAAITGLELGGKSKSTLTEAVKGITADQAGLLAGQFGGQRLATLEGNELSRQGNETSMQQLAALRDSLVLMKAIAENTERTATNTTRLSAIEKLLDSIDKKMNNTNNALRASGG